MACIEILMAELVVIDRQDRVYWQTEIPNRDEKFEYLVRQDRRRAIMAELTEVMQGIENSRENGV
jgi:hypothetical protein